MWRVGERSSKINVKTLPRLSSFEWPVFLFLFFCECFKKKKPVGFLTFNLALWDFFFFFKCFFFLPLSVKLTWKLITGIGTQLCYLVPLAICWLLKKNATDHFPTLLKVWPLKSLSVLCNDLYILQAAWRLTPRLFKKEKEKFIYKNIQCFSFSLISFWVFCFWTIDGTIKGTLLCWEKWLPTWVNFFRTDSQIDNLWFKCTLRLTIFYTIESIEV